MSARPILLGPEDLNALLRRIGNEIAHDHPDGVVLVGVLKGALLFLADLARAIPDIAVEVDFIAISRFAQLRPAGTVMRTALAAAGARPIAPSASPARPGAML